MGGTGRQDVSELIEELGVTSLIKLGIAAVALLVFLVLISLVPGIDRLIPGLPVTYAAMISAFVTLAIVIVLFRFAATTRSAIQNFRTSIEGVANEVAAIFYWTIAFLGVVIAYEGFAPSIEPLAIESDVLWAYDGAFFVLGIITLAILGYHCLRLLDPLAELIVLKIRSDGTSDDTIQTKLPIESARTDEWNQ